MTDPSQQIVADFKAFVDEFINETDRALVVLTAARLDFLLLAILKKYLVINPSKSDEFFENQGPGASFSNKISITYRLGIIDADFSHSLNLVRSLRNDFAHEVGSCSLAKGSHVIKLKHWH